MCIGLLDTVWRNPPHSTDIPSIPSIPLPEKSKPALLPEPTCTYQHRPRSDLHVRHRPRQPLREPRRRERRGRAHGDGRGRRPGAGRALLDAVGPGAVGRWRVGGGPKVFQNPTRRRKQGPWDWRTCGEKVTGWLIDPRGPGLLPDRSCGAKSGCQEHERLTNQTWSTNAITRLANTGPKRAKPCTCRIPRMTGWWLQLARTKYWSAGAV